MAKKRFRMRGNVWQLVGLAVLAVITFGVVAYALVPAPAPASVAAPVAKPTATPTPAPKPVVAFIGDSYTAGAGASTPAMRWTTRLSVSAGFKEVNLGQGGTGYATSSTAADGTVRREYAASIPEAVKAAPDVVIVSGGRNDAPEQSAVVIAAIDDFYTRLRAAMPKVKIIAVSPVWDAGTPPKGVDLVATSAKAAVERVGGAYLDIGQPLAGHPEFIIADKIHPNDSGAAALAEATKVALRQSPAASVMTP